jgi:hypothetical protein
MSQRANGYQAVYARAHGNCGTSSVTVKSHCLIKYNTGQWVFKNRNVRECRNRHVKGGFVVNALKNLLHHRKARNDLIASHRLRIPIRSTTAKHLDPSARVNEYHLVRLPPTAACSRSDTHWGTVPSFAAEVVSES